VSPPCCLQQAVKLVRGVEIKQDADNFVFAVFSVISWWVLGGRLAGGQAGRQGGLPSVRTLARARAPHPARRFKVVERYKFDGSASSLRRRDLRRGEPGSEPRQGGGGRRPPGGGRGGREHAACVRQPACSRLCCGSSLTSARSWRGRRRGHRHRPGGAWRRPVADGTEVERPPWRREPGARRQLAHASPPPPPPPPPRREAARQPRERWLDRPLHSHPATAPPAGFFQPAVAE
jgi:hypothetical protein